MIKYNISRMADFINHHVDVANSVAIILGSGLGGFTDRIENQVVIKYQDIPEYPLPTVEGHSGEFVAGTYKTVKVLAAKGRFHYYEGHNLETVQLPIKLFHKLGIKHLVITNAAGSVKKSLVPGSLMVISGYADCTFRTSFALPKIIRHTTKDMLEIVEKARKKVNVRYERGIYCWTQGPAYETAAEVEFIRSLGGDAVGMSTVPELQAADELNMEALGISTITNYAAGILNQPLTHQEVIDTANRTKNSFAKLIGATMENIGKLK